ncbi:MAG: hypothetical protein ACIAS6_12315 [Phycisphaerales bacterium JB060]
MSVLLNQTVQGEAGAFDPKVSYDAGQLVFSVAINDPDDNSDLDVVGDFTLFDLVAFQNAFAAGCP